MVNPFFKNYGPFKISEVEKFLNIKINSLNKDIEIKDIKDLLTSTKDDLTFFHSKNYKDIAKTTKASFCLTTETLKNAPRIDPKSMQNKFHNKCCFCHPPKH